MVHQYLCPSRSLALALAVLLLVLAPAGGVSASEFWERPEACPTLAQPEFINRPRQRTHPGILYEMRPAVRGGSWPYRFVLEAGPEGMRIDAATGTVSWTAPEVETSATVHLSAIDTAGRRAEQTFDLTVTTEGCYVVSPDGDDAHPGTLAQPWRTLMRAVTGEGVADPDAAVLYLRGGDHVVDVPADEGKTNANILRVTKASPRAWVAWPGEQPVIDLGWSREQWDAVLEPQRQAGVEEPKSLGWGRRIALGSGTSGQSFTGLEVKNACTYMFVLRSGQHAVSWWRCRFHDLWADYRENPAFIFTFAVDRTGGGDWGVRPKADGYRHLVIQDCHFHDRHYWSPRGVHGGGFIFFTVRDSLVEDNLFERIERGCAFMDKDNGWGNTYRCNTVFGQVALAAQGSNDEVVVHHNLIHGSLVIGQQPGWMRNIWVHHNTIHGSVSLLGGGTRPEIPLEGDPEDFKGGPLAEASQEAIRTYPADRRTVHFYRNIVSPSLHSSADDADIVLRLSDQKMYADRWRMLRWNENAINDAAAILLQWSRKRITFTDLRASGLGLDDLIVPMTFDEDGLPQGHEPWATQYGHRGVTP